jgi:hypothetical protein
MGPRNGYSGIFLRQGAAYLDGIEMATDERISPLLRHDSLLFADNLE